VVHHRGWQGAEKLEQDMCHVSFTLRPAVTPPLVAENCLASAVQDAPCTHAACDITCHCLHCWCPECAGATLCKITEEWMLADCKAGRMLPPPLGHQSFHCPKQRKAVRLRPGGSAGKVASRL
jgi:hypothetical protein